MFAAVPFTKQPQATDPKLKTNGSFLMASGQKEANPQVNINNFNISSSNSKQQKQPNADLMGIGAVGGKGYSGSAAKNRL